MSRFGRAPCIVLSGSVAQHLAPTDPHSGDTAAKPNRRYGVSGQKIPHDMAVDIGDAEIAPLMPEAEAGMVDAKKVHDRGL